MTMCDTLESDCIDSGAEPERCVELGLAVCPGDRCLACERTLDACEAAAGACEQIAEHCDAALGACRCGAPCRATVELTMPQLFAVCFAWPLALGCDVPDVGRCFTTITWQGCAGLTTCEYIACMEAVEQQLTCGETPPECVEIKQCIEAEAVGAP